MEGANRIVDYKPYPRTTAFDGFRAKRNKQRLDTIPLHGFKRRNCKNCLERFFVLAVHAL